MTRRSSALHTVLLLGATLVAGSPASAQSLDSLVNARIGPLATGAVAGVYHEGELTALSAWGSPRQGTTDSVRVDVLFPFPSLTEILIAATVRALDASGALDADAPIGPRLPGLSEELGRITLDQLLRHTAGLDDAVVPEGATLAALSDSLPARAVFTDPGVIHSYSRYSYPLAARVLEVATGMPVEDVIAQAVFRPLGMLRSTFDRAEARRRGLAEGYERPPEGGGMPQPAEVAERVDGLPVVYTTVPEILQFLAAWMGGGVAGGPDALPPAPPLHPPEEYLADGFWHDRYLLYEELEQGGPAMGHSLVVRAYPETQTAIAVWVNGYGTLHQDVAGMLSERLFGPDVPVRVTEELPDSAAEARSQERLPLWAWEGRYLNGDRAIELRTPVSPEITSELAFYNGNRELPLERLEDGSILARLPEDGRPAVRFWALRDDEGRRYLLYGGRAFRLLNPRPRTPGG